MVTALPLQAQQFQQQAQSLFGRMLQRRLRFTQPARQTGLLRQHPGWEPDQVSVIEERSTRAAFNRLDQHAQR